ncbi:MAG TPA: beta-ketoacyl-ACP synthase III [Acidimicrobiales bacterium]|nr:beta-ketoacyl-ACP synthase III [Acidimicrobiales bacterium]
MIERGSVIAGWGTALPALAVSNHDIESLIATSDEWIVERSGIRSRRVAAGPFVSPPPPAHPPGGVGTTAALAIEAGRHALKSAGTTAQEISLLILCTSSPDQAMPATSSAVAHRLGIGGGAMDLNAACAGFAYGLITAAALVSSGVGNVLLIGAETMTRVTDWEDRSSAFLFGDGAGAVVLQAVPGPGALLGYDLGVDGSLVELLYADHGSGMAMRGREIFRQAVRATTDSANASLRRAAVEAREIALFVPHQANRRIMDAVAERLAIPSERIASVVECTGNTSAASIPLALAAAVDNGRLKPGDLVLVAGFGAGMTWASAVWRWGDT